MSEVLFIAQETQHLSSKATQTDSRTQLQRPGPAHLAAAAGSVLRRRGALGFSLARASRPTHGRDLPLTRAYGCDCIVDAGLHAAAPRRQSLVLTALALAGLDISPCFRAPCAPWRPHGGPDWRLGRCLLHRSVPANHLGQEQHAAAQLDVGRRVGCRGGGWGRGLVWARGGPSLCPPGPRLLGGARRW